MIPYRVFSHYSIQKSALHIDDLVNQSFNIKVPAVCLTDYHSLSGIPEFLQLIEKKNKKSEHKVKPVVGLTLSLGGTSDITLIAKNKNGWYSLVRLLSLCRASNKKINGQEYITYPDLIANSKDIICISDRADEELSNLFQDDYYTAFEQLANNKYEHGVYYINKEDALYQQIVICSQLKTTLEEIKLNVDLGTNTKFFNNQDLSYSPSNDDVGKFLLNCEPFSVEDKPNIPIYLDDNNQPVLNADDYLTNLCRNGWKQLNINNNLNKQIYLDRIKEELDVIKQAGISNYYLLVKDFLQYCRSNGQSAGLRGSAVGSLIFYLIGVTDIDPVWPDPSIPYDADKSLLFSRFINKGRFLGGKASLPDADIDIHPSSRDDVKKYIRNKYGEHRVADIITFSKMKGAKAIKETFRVLGRSFEFANQVTRDMIDEAKVQDELEDIKEDNPKYNIINYCIDNIPTINNYYKEFKYEFDIAIKLTNTIVNESKHAAGVLIANRPINEFIPIKYEMDTGSNMACLKKEDIEYVGGVKMDLLGVLAYEKIDAIVALINRSDSNGSKS